MTGRFMRPIAQGFNMSPLEVETLDIFTAMIYWESSHDEAQGYTDWVIEITSDRADKSKGQGPDFDGLMGKLHTLKKDDPALADGNSHFQFLCQDRGLDQKYVRNV